MDLRTHKNLLSVFKDTCISSLTHSRLKFAKKGDANFNVSLMNLLQNSWMNIYKQYIDFWLSISVKILCIKDAFCYK